MSNDEIDYAANPFDPPLPMTSRQRARVQEEFDALLELVRARGGTVLYNTPWYCENPHEHGQTGCTCHEPPESPTNQEHTMTDSTVSLASLLDDDDSLLVDDGRVLLERIDRLRDSDCRAVLRKAVFSAATKLKRRQALETIGGV